jgi:hypothetical protein
MVETVEPLICKCEALSSNPSPTIKKTNIKAQFTSEAPTTSVNFSPIYASSAWSVAQWRSTGLDVQGLGYILSTAKIKPKQNRIFSIQQTFY